MADQTIKIIPIDETVTMVQIDRAPNNFFDVDLIAAISDAYESLAAGNKVRAIVLAADGKNFCAGANFSSQASGAAAPARPAGDNALYTMAARLMATPLPVVAAVRGAAVGGGLGLACSADFRVGSVDTRLTANFAQLGFHHGFGLTVTLPRIVGNQRATELLYTGKRIGGEEGHAIGLIDRLVSNENIDAAAIAFAQEIASSAPLALRSIRATMRQGLVDAFRAATDHEGEEQAWLRKTNDFREGIKATAERRPPVFTGE